MPCHAILMWALIHGAAVGSTSVDTTSISTHVDVCAGDVDTKANDSGNQVKYDVVRDEKVVKPKPRVCDVTCLMDGGAWPIV